MLTTPVLTHFYVWPFQDSTMRPLLEMLLAIVALATHTSGLPYGELPPQLQAREYANAADKPLDLSEKINS